jgi:rhodanese-related sulfurtransferase
MEPVPAVTVDQLPNPLPDDLTVLDVREAIEWDQAHVPGSLHIPMAELPARVGELPTEGQVLVVCAVGARSARAAGWLVRQGHDAINLDGGLVEWQSAGRELVSG